MLRRCRWARGGCGGVTVVWRCAASIWQVNWPCPGHQRPPTTYLEVVGLSNGLLENISTTRKQGEARTMAKKGCANGDETRHRHTHYSYTLAKQLTAKSVIRLAIGRCRTHLIHTGFPPSSPLYILPAEEKKYPPCTPFCWEDNDIFFSLKIILPQRQVGRREELATPHGSIYSLFLCIASGDQCQL